MAELFGIDSVRWGVVCVVGTSMGSVTPPYGLNLFFVSGVMEVPYAQVMRRIPKLLIRLMAAWILVTLMLGTTLLIQTARQPE